VQGEVSDKVILGGWTRHLNDKPPYLIHPNYKTYLVNSHESIFERKSNQAYVITQIIPENALKSGLR